MTSDWVKPSGTTNGSVHVLLAWPYAEPAMGSKPIGPSTATATPTESATTVLPAVIPPINFRMLASSSWLD